MNLFPNKTKTFIEQFVPRQEFERFGVLAGSFIHPAIVDFVEDFQNFLGRSVVVNDWSTGGNLELNGWVPFNGSAIPSFVLQFGGACVKFKVEGLSTAEVFEAVVRLKMAGAFPGIKRILNPAPEDEFLVIDTLEADGQEGRSIFVWEMKR